MTKRLLPLFLTLALLAAPLTPARAQIPVTDVINWIQNALQCIQQYLEIVQRYEVLYRQWLQYGTMLKNLEHIEIDDWSDLVSLYYALDGILRQTESLGYTATDLTIKMNETYPGLLTPEEYTAGLQTANGWVQQTQRVRRTLTTMTAVTQLANRISWNNQPSQMHLQSIQHDVDAAEGALQIAQAAAEFDGHNAETLGKILQTNLATVNSISVATSYFVQRDAAAAAALQAWIAEPYPDYAPDDPRFAKYSAIPRNWPWPCWGCNH